MEEMTVPLDTVNDIRSMDAAGRSRSEIARMPHVSRNTVAKYADMWIGNWIGYTGVDSSGRGARDGRAVMGEKGERPERVFPGRTDPWFIATMVIVAGGLSAACIACFLSSSPALLWGWLALLPIPALVALAALPVRSNRLELYGDRLVVVYAGTRSVIPYAHVRGVRRTRTLWAGTANSLDRVYIEAPYDGDAIVSVRDNDALVAELGHRCGLGPDA